jgi:hypothetical protein
VTRPRSAVCSTRLDEVADFIKREHAPADPRDELERWIFSVVREQEKRPQHRNARGRLKRHTRPRLLDERIDRFEKEGELPRAGSPTIATISQ